MTNKNKRSKRQIGGVRRRGGREPGDADWETVLALFSAGSRKHDFLLKLRAGGNEPRLVRELRSETERTFNVRMSPPSAYLQMNDLFLRRNMPYRLEAETMPKREVEWAWRKVKLVVRESE